MNNEQKLIDELVGDEFTEQILQELGIHNAPKEAQADVLARVGRTILEKIVLEVLTVLKTEADRDEFESLVGSGDAAGMRRFLESHIPDSNDFIVKHAANSLESIKTRIHQLSQGVV